MQAARFVIAVAVLGSLGGLAGCKSVKPKNPFRGSLRCSCSTVGCGCSHCCGKDDECRCQADDAYGTRTSVGEPGD